MQQIDLTILVPGIRPHFWQRFYDSVIESCTQFSYEIIFTGPFDPPESLKDKIFFLKTYSPNCVAMQKATLLGNGRLICHLVDDGIILPNSLDSVILQYYNQCRHEDIINMRYTEGINFKQNMMPIESWKASSDYTLTLPFINPDWYMAVQPLMTRQYFIDLGGFDCRFEFSNHAHHDFAFRAQLSGSRVVFSQIQVCSADHTVGYTGDHVPIHHAQKDRDSKKFTALWSQPRSVKINYDNYKPYDKTWTGRFKKEYKTYEEMMNDYEEKNSDYWS